MVWDDQHQVNARRGSGAGLKLKQFERGLAIQEVAVLTKKPGADFLRSRRDSSIHVLLEQPLQFRASFMSPLRFGADLFATRKNQWVRQFGFICLLRSARPGQE
jgi:hypothetical protein